MKNGKILKTWAAARVKLGAGLSRWLWLLLSAGVFSSFSTGAQTVLLNEDFEGYWTISGGFPLYHSFPSGWSVGDSNLTAGLAYWDDVNADFGSVAPHDGLRKGYCAAVGYTGTTNAPRYTNYMQAYMTRSVSLTNHPRANLSFWYSTPSIERSYDYLKVYVGTNLLWYTSDSISNWAQVNLTLNGYGGSSAQIRFQFDADSIYNYEGAYLDDIRVTASTQPLEMALLSLTNLNYSGYLLAYDPLGTRTNIQSQAIWRAENFTGTNTTLNGVARFKLIDAQTLQPQLLFTGSGTNAALYYDLTNTLSVPAAASLQVTNLASLVPAVRLSHLKTYYLECQLLTNGSPINSISLVPAVYFHFTNTTTDSSLNALATLQGAAWTQTYAVSNLAGSDAFAVSVDFELRRWDNYLAGLGTNQVGVRFTSTLYDNLGNEVPLVSDTSTFLVDVPNFVRAFIFPFPAVVTGTRTLSVQPKGQLDSVNKTYYLRVSLAHTNNPLTGQVLLANDESTSETQLLHFNGRVLFGAIPTRLTRLLGDPPTNAPSGGYVPTTLSGPGGYVIASPAHTYSTAATFEVKLASNGDASVAVGSVTLAAPIPDVASVTRIAFRRGLVTLNPVGGVADVTARLPLGLGYRANTDSLVLQSEVPFTGVSLNASLAPRSASLTYAPGATLYAAEESKPVWFEISQMTWTVAAGSFELFKTGAGASYVRADAFNYLTSVSNLLVAPTLMGDKRSNDRYWLGLAGADSNPTFRTGTSSNALTTATFSINPSSFRTHFPYDSLVSWSGAGHLAVTNDQAVPGPGSQLTGAATVGVTYDAGCPDCGSLNKSGNGKVISANGCFDFTPDGGLVASGLLTKSTDVTWGYIDTPISEFAQKALAFTEGAFHMPGVFVRGDASLLTSLQGPTTILYTGAMADNPAQLERPMSAGYAAGLADYAGLNFRANDVEHRASSTIANLRGIDWILIPEAKYYVRPAGVTGIHQAVPNTFPAALKLWGYDFTFASYALSYLDSQNRDSLTDGSVILRGPAKFTNGFESLTFTCLGQPDRAEVAEGEGNKFLSYWLADFKVYTLRFQTPIACPPLEGYLILGIEGHASHFTNSLFGEIGFFSSGDMIPASFGLAGITSRLKVPNVMRFDGPNGSTYTFTPAQDGYYNTFAQDPGGSAGWINLFGKLDVPFFEDLQLHLQTSCRTNGAPGSTPIHLAGGWPREGASGDPLGWVETLTGFTPFQTNLFDGANSGWPGSAGGLTVTKYRDNSEEKYHPRAQRVWLGVVNFDYPLSWNSDLRSFKSWQQVKAELLVVDVQHEIKYLDGLRAEINFGAQYDGLPQISVANLAFNAIDESTGVSAAVAEAASAPVRDVLNQGLDRMNQLLDTQLNRLLDGVFDKTVDPLIDRYYTQLSNNWAAVMANPTASKGQQFLQGVQSNNVAFFLGTGPGAAAGNLNQILLGLGNGLSASTNLIGQLQRYIGDATNSINAIVGTISAGADGVPLGEEVQGLIAREGENFPVVPKLVQSLAGQFAGEFVDAVAGPVLDQAVADLKPVLTELTTQLIATRSALVQVSTNLDAGAQFAQELQQVMNAYPGQFTNLGLRVSMSVTQYFGQLNYSVDNPFQHLPASEVKAFIRQHIEDEFCGTDAAAKIQSSLRQRLYDVDAAMKSQLDSVFQQLNGVLRDLIGQSLAELDNSINQCLGDVNEVLGAGQLNGHAIVNGESLTELRIDGHFQLKVPDDLELNAFLLIRELTSDGSPTSCYDSNAPATEVTLGATRIPIHWLSPDLEANVQTKFTFDGSSPYPVNVGGQLELLGELSFEAFVLHDLAVAMAMGKYENYLALRGGVRMNGYDFSGAAFFGKTCSLDPLLLIDPDVAKVLGDPPFTGAYCYAQGWLPVSEMVTGVPASCLFSVSAGVGAGAFYFTEGPTYGGKMFLGVAGELLCLVSISGEITMIGVKRGDDLRFTGNGYFEAEVGPCPFCISVSKSVSISYVNKSWHLD
jgi:hypothetical protein